MGLWFWKFWKFLSIITCLWWAGGKGKMPWRQKHTAEKAAEFMISGKQRGVEKKARDKKDGWVPNG